MTDLDRIADLERLARAATPGPWQRANGSYTDWAHVYDSRGWFLANVYAVCQIPDGLKGEDEFRQSHPFGTPEYDRGPEQPAANADYIVATGPDTLLWLIGLARPNADKVMLDRIEAQRVLRTLVGYRCCDTMTPGEIVAAESYLTAALKETK